MAFTFACLGIKKRHSDTMKQMILHSTGQNMVQIKTNKSGIHNQMHTMQRRSMMTVMRRRKLLRAHTGNLIQDFII